MKQLKCFIRDSFGTSNSKRLRKAGMTPGIVYTMDTQNVPLYFSSHDLLLLRNQGRFNSTPLELIINDNQRMVVIPKKCDLHPVKEDIIHIEFIADDGNDKVISVPVFYPNLDKSPGYKNNGFFNITQRNLKIKGKISSAPAVLEKDISQIKTGDVIRAEDIQLPAGYVISEKNPRKVIANMMGKGGGESKK